MLRIEDIDQSRARPEWEAQIYDDLAWLGLEWETPVMRQSDRLDLYRDAIEDLWQRDLLFACSCNRRDIREAASAPQEGSPVMGPDGIVYPGTCRHRRRSRSLPHAPEGYALRLDMSEALSVAGAPNFKERLFTENAQTSSLSSAEMVQTVGDVVIARRDMGTSYHLSVVVDDADQDITDVVRGEDLFEATFIHVVLQGLFGFPMPSYHHHRLIRDDDGKRLAKRDDARAIALYRDNGASPRDIRGMVGL